jgi:predicted HTH domain antitoxin
MEHEPLLFAHELQLSGQALQLPEERRGVGRRSRKMAGAYLCAAEVINMAKLVLEIPEEVHAALRLPPGEVERELRKELALALYQHGVLSFGKARALAYLTHWEFEELLGQRKVFRHYSKDDLAEDIRYAGGS